MTEEQRRLRETHVEWYGPTKPLTWRVVERDAVQWHPWVVVVAALALAVGGALIPSHPWYIFLAVCVVIALLPEEVTGG